MNKKIFEGNERELINLGISIAAGCQPCTRYHIRKCREAKISDTLICNVIKRTEQICKNAFEIITANALATINEIHNTNQVLQNDEVDKIDILIGLAVSYTLNSTALYAVFLDRASVLEIGRKEISGIIEISNFIYDKAKAHVEILCDEYGIENKSNDNGDCTQGCRC